MSRNDGKADMDKKLIAIYKKYGVKVFLDVCSEMLNIKDKTNADKKKKSNGEVCEVVLDVLTQHYLMTRKLIGETYHSMILADKRNPKSNFRTELDFTLFTPFFCVTGECKSYVGNIEVVGDCTLLRDSTETDVAKQSNLHARYLKQYLEDFSLSDTGMSAPPLGMFCFVYSNGAIHDSRNSTAKKAIPLITIRSLYSYYDQLFSNYRRKVFDYNRACKVFTTMSNSRALREQHRAFLGY